MLEEFGPGDGAFFGNVADDDHGDIGFLGGSDEQAGAITDLGGRTGGGGIVLGRNGLNRVDDDQFGLKAAGVTKNFFKRRGVEQLDVFGIFFSQAGDAGGDLANVFFGTDIEQGGGEADGELGEECRFADTRLAGDEIDAARGEAGTENPVKLFNVGRKSPAGVVFDGLFGGERGRGWTRSPGSRLARFSKVADLNQSIPFMADGALARPLREFVAAGIAHKEGRGFHTLIVQDTFHGSSRTKFMLRSLGNTRGILAREFRIVPAPFQCIL